MLKPIVTGASDLKCRKGQEDSYDKTEYYRAYGLTIRSPFVCHQMAPGCSPEDVGFEEGRLPILGEEAGTYAVAFQYPRQEVQLQLPRVGRFLVQKGQRVIVDPAEDCHPRLLSLRLQGTIMGILAHQRSKLVLHATVVQMEGQTVALAGSSGIGKSTLAAAAVTTGKGRIVTEDVAVIPLDKTPRVQPGVSQLRLWPESARALSITQPLQPIYPGAEKEFFRPAGGLPDRPVPLDAVYIVTRGKQKSSVVHPLPPRKAVLELLVHSYCRPLLDQADELHFRQCAQLVRTVPVRKLELPSNLKKLQEVVLTLQKDKLTRDKNGKGAEVV